MNPDIIETICEILKAKEIDFIHKNKEEFKKDFMDLASLFANLVQSYCLKSKKAGVAYTFFIADDATFSSGKWGDISPTIFWGMENNKINEIERIKFSCYLYYNIWRDENLAYTILWNERLSRYLPYNLEIRMRNNLKDCWQVEFKKEHDLIRIWFSKKIYDDLSQKFDSIYNNNKNRINFNNIKINVEKEDGGLSKVSFNFRDFRDIKSPISINNKLEQELGGLAKKLGGKIKDALNGKICGLNVNDEEKNEITQKLSEDLPKTVLKLLLIGPYPPKFLRLISPKQYIINNNYVGCFAGILRIYEEKIDDNTLQEIYKTALPLLSIVGFRFTTSYFYIFIKNYALRSAIAAIMARNMSHNIGSHVLTNVSTTTGVLNQQDVKILERFLQNRMDFIAQVSTDFPEWSFPFWFYRNLMRDFYMQHLLLKYIASSEGLKPWSYDDTSTNENGQLKIVVKVNGKNIDNSNDVLVSIPGGVIGQHAFYVILEDIIRNAAKHGYSTQNNKDSNLEITIEIEDKPENDYIEVCIYDNVSLITCNNSDDYNKDYPDNFATVDISKLPLHQRMNVYLMKSIIDETGQLRKENWGLAEMRISAGYLQKRKIEEIGQEGEEVLKIIKAVAKENNGRYYLGYQFKMLKPKDVLIVGYENQSSNYNPQQNGIFLENEIPQDLDYEFCVLCVKGKNDLINKIKGLCSTDKTEKNDILTKIEKFPYRLFIATDDTTQLKIPTPLDKRVVLIKKSDIKIDNKNDAENFKLYLYKKWLEHLAKNRGINNLKDVSILVKVTGEDVSGGTIGIDEIFNGVNNLNITEEQKKQIGKNLGLSENYAPPTLPPNLRVTDNISQEPWENMNDDLGVKLESPPRSSTNINLSCSKNFIIYARHKYLESINPSPSYLYFESLSGASPHFILISNPPQDKYQKKKLLYQLVENGLIRIGICDERFLQSSILNTLDNNKIQYNYYLMAGQVYPVGKFLDYQIPNIGPDCVVFIERSNENFEINFCKKNNENQKFKKVNNVAIDIDFLIIHQGILDKLKKPKEEIEGILQKLKTKIPYIIVTSGRGTPPNIPTNVKFLPFSNIESTLLMKPHSKFILTQILMSL